MDWLKQLVGEKTSQQDTKGVPAGAMPLVDKESNEPFGYVLNNVAYDMQGQSMGNFDEIKAKLENADRKMMSEAVGSYTAGNAYNQVSRSAVVMKGLPGEGLPVALPGGVTPSPKLAVIAQSLAVANNLPKPIVGGSPINTPMVFDLSVNNKGIFSDQQYVEDTLPALRMDLAKFMGYLEDQDWPEYITAPAIRCSFDENGLTVTPGAGQQAFLFNPSDLPASPLAYKVIASVKDTLIGNSKLVLYGTAAEYLRIYQFAQVTTGYILLPRQAGGVDSYTNGANSTSTWSGLTTRVQAVTKNDSTSPSVPDDYFIDLTEIAFGGVNVELLITPYIPTRLEVANLLALFRSGANADLIAKTISDLAGLVN